MPAITVSRMFGSGGSEVAAKVAATLGWRLVDSAFVEGVAGRLGTTPAVVQAIEERAPTLAERIADTFALGPSEVVTASLSAPLPTTEDQLLESTRRLIEETLARGPAVLVGRGAQAFLAEREGVIHVFCCAPFASMVRRVVAREGISEVDAESMVREKNRQREQYVRRHWNRNWLSPENYHLTLNTAFLGIDYAASIIVEIANSVR